MEDKLGGIENNAINIDVMELFSYEPNMHLGLESLNLSDPSSYSDSSENYSYSPSASLNIDCIQIPEDVSPVKKKRGRRPIRPNDPVKKKTEEKDKYWLRAFRSFMRTEVESMSKPIDEFWEFYLSRDGKPGKGHRFKSYGKDYKNFLFANDNFAYRFRKWFDEQGETLISKKYETGSDNWFVYFDYAARDLYNYNLPVQHEQQQELPEDGELLINEDIDAMHHGF